MFITTAADNTGIFTVDMFRNWTTSRLAISLALAAAATWLFYALYPALIGTRLPNSPMLMLGIALLFFAVTEVSFVAARKLLGYSD